MGRNDDGRIEIFMVNVTNNMIFHTFQTNAGTSPIGRCIAPTW